MEEDWEMIEKDEFMNSPVSFVKEAENMKKPSFVV